eukprot:jgi/Bigna1/47709/estExt_Genewise1.C_170091
MPESKSEPASEKPKLKICCACPDTRKLRDKCHLLKGPEHCKKEIEAHKVCLRKLGFKI